MLEINVNVNFVSQQTLLAILTNLEKISMDQASAQAALEAANAQLVATQETVVKVSGETTALLAAIANLTDQLANGGPLTPGLEAAVAAVNAQVAAVKAAVEGVDAQVEDAPPAP